MTEDYFTADMGSLFAQEHPNGTMNYLGCHDVGDIAEPQGDVTKRYCQKADGTGHAVALRTRGIPGDVTLTITTYIGKVADYLRGLKRTKCPFALYVNQALCGRRDDALEYDNGTVLKNCLVTNYTKTNTVMREGTDAAEQDFEIVADNPTDDYYKLLMLRQTTTVADDMSDITACGSTHCAGTCGDASEPCDYLFAVSLSPAGVADTAHTHDGGATWTTVAGPFLATMNISSAICFPMGRSTTRVIVARGTTDAGPCDIAITDNDGVAWAGVGVGAVNTEFVPWSGGLFALDEYHVWCVTDTGAGAAGNIYRSVDGGNTWADVGGGADALNYVDFLDYDHGLIVGDTNEILYTANGMATTPTWTTITGPASMAAVDALCCSIVTENRWFVGYQDGTLWFTENGGTTWTQRIFTFPAGAASVNRVNDIKFLDDGYHGVMAIKWTDGAAGLWGSLLRTFNGGTDWEVYSTAAAYTVGAIGMAAAVICDPNLAYGVGDICAATGTIYQASA